MQNKPNLITLILTILLSFTVTSVVWAECDVAISPSATIILPGESLTFTAETEGEGCSEPNYTWELAASDCTNPSKIDENGEYRASDACNCDCDEDIIKVTDTANGNIFAEARVVMTGCCYFPEVTISGPIVLGPPCPISATYIAETTIGDEPISGTYSWELDGVSQGTGNTSNTFEIACTEEGTKTLMVTDTANGNLTASIVIDCYCISDDFNIHASIITGCGTPFIPWFGVVQIEGPPLIEFGITSIVRYDLPLVLPLPRLVNRKDNTITQFVILLPSLFFPVWDYPATVRVTVGDLLSHHLHTDTFRIPECGQ